MKKLLFAFILLAGTFVFVQAQGPEIRLHGYALYAFDDNSVDSYYSANSYFYGSIKGGFQYGGGLEVMPYPESGIELSYLRLDSKAPMEYYDNGVVYSTLDLAQNWILLSFNKYLPVSDKIEPYLAPQIGMNVLNVNNPDNGNTGNVTKLAWGIKGGVNIFANEKVGFKLQMSLLSTVQAVGGGLYFGTGGAGAGVTGYSSYYQFNLGGGLVFGVK